MSRSEHTAPRRGRHASDEPEHLEDALTGEAQRDAGDERPVPAARHALESSPRMGRRLRVGLALTLAALTLGSASALAVRGAGTPLETAVAADAPTSSTPTVSVAARGTDQVNRSRTRSALPAGSASTLTSAQVQAAAKAVAGVKAPATPVVTPSATATPTSAKPVVTPKASKPAWATVLWKARGTRFATSNLNVRNTPTQNSTVVTVVAPGTALKVTEAVYGDYRQVNWNGRVAWVSKAYLALEKPVGKTSSAVSGSSGSTSGSPDSGSSDVSGSCSKSMPAGVISAGRAAALEACKRFPAIGSFGGYRAGDSGEHGSGHAVDMMVSGSAGWAVANWARANAGRLGISEVIYQQKIWTSQRSGDGWRSMSDRGSATANHYDHVHITLR